MSRCPDLTIYAAMKDAGEYAEVLLRSAALHGASDQFHMTMSILVDSSSDNTLSICRTLARELPFDCRVRSVDELSAGAQYEIRALVDSNDGFFNECIWDWLVHENLEQCTYYAGIHVDLAFHRFGLWDELLSTMQSIGADVAGVFAPGELLGDHATFCLTPPRIFPVVALCHRERARALGIKWSRPCATRGRLDRLIIDNGTMALDALMGSQAVAMGATFLPVTMDYLEKFVKHFGFLWTQNSSSFIHGRDGEQSRECVRAELRKYRGKARLSGSLD